MRFRILSLINTAHFFDGYYETLNERMMFNRQRIDNRLDKGDSLWEQK